MNECECGFARMSERWCKCACVCVCLRMCACVSVCVTYDTWVAGGLRVLDIYANHFEVLAVIMDQDVQAGAALAARVSNQFFVCNMWTVNRSCDPTFFFC